jgi:hypothetical protein
MKTDGLPTRPNPWIFGKPNEYNLMLAANIWIKQGPYIPTQMRCGTAHADR